MCAVQLAGARSYVQLARLIRGCISKTPAIGMSTSQADTPTRTRFWDEEEESMDDVLRRENELERKRNKSRLRTKDRNVLLGQVPYSEPKCWIHKTVKYRRKLYGTYGQASGVNVGICWPTKAELEEIKEYENICHPFTLQQMMKDSKEKRAAEEERIGLRDEEVARKVDNLETWKRELEERIRKKEAVAMAAKAKKDRLVEEVRRHFGYKVDPRNEKFQEMLEAKEKAEKKRLKQERKAAKESQALARLTQMSQQLEKQTEKKEEKP